MDVECEANGHTESTVMDPSLSSHFIQPQIASHAMMRTLSGWLFPLQLNLLGNPLKAVPPHAL